MPNPLNVSLSEKVKKKRKKSISIKIFSQKQFPEREHHLLTSDVKLLDEKLILLL